jgi:hypothetical protein
MAKIGKICIPLGRYELAHTFWSEKKSILTIDSRFESDRITVWACEMDEYY